MKQVFYALFILLCYFSNAQDTLLIATLEYPPLYQTGLSHQGLACDLLCEALKTENIKIEYSFKPPLRMISDIKHDITLCGLGSNLKKQNDRLIVSESLFDVRLVFIYDSRKHPNGILYDSISDLSKFTIGVLAKSGTEEYLSTFQNLNIAPNTSNPGLAKQLRNGRVDLWATVDIAGFITLKELFPNNYKYYRCTKPFNKSEINVIIPENIENGDELVASINRGLATIHHNGKYEEIIDTYLGDLKELLDGSTE